jgi:hypothetical protein
MDCVFRLLSHLTQRPFWGYRVNDLTGSGAYARTQLHTQLQSTLNRRSVSNSDTFRNETEPPRLDVSCGFAPVIPFQAGRSLAGLLPNDYSTRAAERPLELSVFDHIQNDSAPA